MPLCKASLDTAHPFGYLLTMEIESVNHKPPRSYIETGKAKGLIEPKRIRNMVAYLVAIDDVNELKIPPNFGAHELTGDRAGTWALTVTRNWRMTFRLDDEGRIIDLDLEDYH